MPNKSDKDSSPRRYYSIRAGRNPGAINLDLPTLKTLWQGRVQHFLQKEYFQGAFGKDCVDGAGHPGEIGDDIPGHMLLKIRKHNLWPIHQYLESYAEDDLLDVTEFLFDHVSVPSGGYNHNYNNCGWHHTQFDKVAGRREFCSQMNEILHDYGAGYELSEDGEIVGAVQAGELFVSAQPTRRKLTFSPGVFRLPEDLTVDGDLVALMMPFDNAFKPTHEAVRVACAFSGYRCQRVDDIWEESVLVQDIFNLICRARVVVVDFSGKNGNVLYETGIAHALGKLVVPIAQNATDVPFDLQHHRYLKYLPNGEGLSRLQSDLASRLKQLSGGGLGVMGAHGDIQSPPHNSSPDDDEIPF